MPEFIHYGAQLLRVAVKSMSSDGWIGIPPVDGEAVIPEVRTLLNVCGLDAGIKAMHLAPTVGHAGLKLVVIAA